MNLHTSLLNDPVSLFGGLVSSEEHLSSEFPAVIGRVRKSAFNLRGPSSDDNGDSGSSGRTVNIINNNHNNSAKNSFHNSVKEEEEEEEESSSDSDESEDKEEDGEGSEDDGDDDDDEEEDEEDSSEDDTGLLFTGHESEDQVTDNGGMVCILEKHPMNYKIFLFVAPILFHDFTFLLSTFLSFYYYLCFPDIVGRGR